MDIRSIRTKSRIIDAFMQLRSRHPLEKIKVIDICKLAQINKTTFYRHYEDIIALADEAENELIDRFMEDLNQRKSLYDDPREFFLTLDNTLNFENEVHKTILFSDQWETMFEKLEASLKKQYLEGRSTLRKYIEITYVLGGAVNVFLRFYRYGIEVDVYEVYDIIAELTKKALK
jgi:AcrR family transcriptional regulator